MIPKINEWSSPLDALHHAISYLTLSSMLGPSNNRPGYVIDKLSRQNPLFYRAITKLTSEMTQNERPWWTK